MPREQDDNAARDLYLNLVQAYEQLHGEFSSFFRDHGLTQAQYNVLRILVGGPKAGVPCQYVGQRLITRVPDVTRLLDRMEAAGLLERTRSTEDRRVVVVRISAEGRRLCQSLARPVSSLHRRQLAHLPPRTVKALNQGLQALLKAN
jgi:DNA-binding MarR family transcriptional regulator